MTLMDPPILEHLIGSPSSAALEDELRPRLNELMNLSYAGLMNRFTSDGFTDSNVRELEAIVSALLNETELAEQLAAMLNQVEDMENQDEVKARLFEWLDAVNWETIYQKVRAAALPDPIDALAYAACHIRNLATSTIWFEATRHTVSKQPQPDWRLDKAQINDGIALAEAGLAQEASEWPAY